MIMTATLDEAAVAETAAARMMTKLKRILRSLRINASTTCCLKTRILMVRLTMHFMHFFVLICDSIKSTSPSETHLKNRNTPVLWQFLLMCLGNAHCNPSLIEWVSKESATFRLTNVNALANLWGQIKKRPRMNGDHFKRSLRYV